MSSGSGTQTTTTTAPSFQVPYQQYGLNQAYSNYQNGAQVAPFAPQQEQAINNITGMANNGTAVGNAANNYASGILNNGPSQNPYLDATFGQAAQATQGQLASQFAGAGRNVGESQDQRSQQLNQLATQIYGGAYNTGVQQQEQAASLAPTLDQNQYNNQNQLFNAGQSVQNLANQYIQAPQQRLNQYLSQVSGNLGATQSTPYTSNSAAGGLGGALIGGQLGGALTPNSPYGTLIGGLLGGVAGAYG